MKLSIILPILASLTMATAAPQGATASMFEYSQETILNLLKQHAELAVKEEIFTVPQHNIVCEAGEKSVACEVNKPTVPPQNNFATVCQEFGCGDCTSISANLIGGPLIRGSFRCEINRPASK